MAHLVGDGAVAQSDKMVTINPELHKIPMKESTIVDFENNDGRRGSPLVQLSSVEVVKWIQNPSLASRQHFLKLQFFVSSIKHGTINTSPVMLHLEVLDANSFRTPLSPDYGFHLVCGNETHWDGKDPGWPVSQQVWESAIAWEIRIPKNIRYYQCA